MPDFKKKIFLPFYKFHFICRLFLHLRVDFTRIQQTKSPNRMVDTAGIGPRSSPRKLVECKICHDADEDSSMETPCSCSGSLKYAHRLCVQRWCNVKGDTICEICRQCFEPGYTDPSPLSRNGGFTRSLAGGWQISRRTLPNMNYMGLVPVDDDFLDLDFVEYPSPSSRSLMLCRTVAVIFIGLLVLRNTLPIIISGTEMYSPTLFLVIILRMVGILLPMYVMVKAFTAIQQCRHQQVSLDSRFSLFRDGHESAPMHQPPQHAIHLR